MGKYDKHKYIVLPLSGIKTSVTSAVPTIQSISTTAGPGNEGIVLTEWIQERIDDGTIDLNGFVPSVSTNLSFSRDSSTVTISSDTGTDATIPIATSSLAGILTAADKIKLDALPTLTGVSIGALNLGVFTGTIIPDNVTVKDALQALETKLDTIPSITLGNLTPTNTALTITGGSNAVLGTGTTIQFNPANVLLSTLGGELNLSQLDTSGATTGDFIMFDGTEYVPQAYIQTIPDHNDLTNIQGGISNEYYHLSSTVYNKLVTTTADTLIGRIGTTGSIQEIPLSGSLEFNSGNLRFINDNATPGNTKYYGTNSSGVKGWYDATFTGVTSLSATDSADIDFTVTNPTTTPVITGILVNTGVTAGTYGTASSVGSFTVNSKGRITSAVDIPISLTSANISDLPEYIDDRVAGTLVAGTNISIVYDDTANTITISNSSSLGTGITNKVAYWSDVDTLTADNDLGFDGTYLTVGSPIASSLARLTTKGLGSTLSTFGYIHENSSNVEVFKVADNGAITIGSLGDILIHPDQMNISASGEYAISKSGGDLTLYSDTQVKVESGGTSTTTPSLKVVATRATAVGAVYNAQIEGTFTAASGSNRYTDLHVKTIVNQTGGTSPIRSVYIEPTITAATNYVGLEINAPGHTALKTTAGNVSFNFGSDATGDIYYRNASGNLVRLPIGGPTEVLGSTGTVPAWTTTAGSLPGGSDGDILMYIGGWVSATRQVEKLTGITGTAATLGATPLALAPFDLYRNGVRQDDTDDYSISGTSITMIVALAATDKLTAVYYI